MEAPFSRITWYGYRINDAVGDTLCHATGEAETQFILENLNKVNELRNALVLLLSDVEGSVDYGMPFDNPEHGFHESVMAARKALKP